MFKNVLILSIAMCLGRNLQATGESQLTDHEMSLSNETLFQQAAYLFIWCNDLSNARRILSSIYQNATQSQQAHIIFLFAKMYYKEEEYVNAFTKFQEVLNNNESKLSDIAESNTNLGTMFFSGQGVERNYQTARMYFANILALNNPGNDILVRLLAEEAQTKINEIDRIIATEAQIIPES